MYNIYKITNATNGKLYIGQTKRNALARFNDHKFSSRKRHASLLHADMAAIGIENFSLQIIESCEECDADAREKYWIEFYESTNPEKGYNKAKGGRGNPGMEVSEETRAKLRASNKGFTPEAREKIRLKAIGRKLNDEHAEAVRMNGFRIAKKVQQYSRDMELLNEFPSIIEASRATRTDRRTIQRQLNKEYAMNGSARSNCNIKFYWKYKE